MLCPKCKQEIEDNSLKCGHCGARVGLLCKDCGSYNEITATSCTNCGKILIKFCKDCGAANRPNATKCRKCGSIFNDENEGNNNLAETEESIQPIYFASMNSQQKVKSKLIEGIRNSASRIITINGESGSGKNLILNSAINELKNNNILWLMANCTQISQLSPFGCFQDILLTFFNINNFCPDTLQLKKNSLKFFKQDFPSLTNSEIIDLLNLLYPDNLDKYENIYYNKAKTFDLVKKVLATIVEKMKVVFIIDNFELIDGMSYDFIKELLNDDYMLERCKFIIVCTEPKPGLGLINSQKLSEENYLDLAIAPFTQTQIETFIKQNYKQEVTRVLSTKAIKISNGNPAILEQIIQYQNDIIQNNIKEKPYTTFDNLINLRLEILKNEDYHAYRFLSAMSVLGEKFYPAMLEHFDNLSPTEFERIISKLIDAKYIVPINNLAFEFKSKLLWKAIISITKLDNNFEEILNILYEILSIYKQSSVALLGYIVQKLNNNDQAFDVWTLLMKQASYVGDIGLYIITQKQALKLIENKTSEFYVKVKKNIYTRVGKLLEPIDHNASFEYLQKAIMMLEDHETALHIELLGYIASCSMKSGNYWGAIECVDNVLNHLPDTMGFSKVLIKSRQIRPLLRLGNYGQLINIVETELLPEIEKVLGKGKNLSQIKLHDLFNIWLDIYFDFAETLTLQGDCKAFEIIQTIYDILEKNNVKDPVLTCKVNLLLALAHTIKGDIETSKSILEDILKEYSLDSMDAFVVSRWNFIDILNKFFEKDYNTLHSELFNVAAYANNTNDTFTKNILKTLLAKILKDNNQTKKALEILEEQVAYFAKEKVSTGVLLAWYLIAEIKLITNGTQFALDIATKALDIAQGPSINNYYFTALFNKLIGEIYLAKQDFESAKVYIEKSVFVSKLFGLEQIQVKAYLLCAKLYQELALPKSGARGDYIKQALKMFQLAKNVPIVARHEILQKKIKEDLSILTSFCKLNGIVLRKENK
ncbi:MAG: hypothetical protein MJ231_01955 [bacterium]|nr:hypothetical protein [bacterium]